MKRALRSASASADVLSTLDLYLVEAPHAAQGFIAALEKAVGQIERQPGIGSPRYAHELDMPGLRHWTLSRYPYALFYLVHDARLDIIRLVHMSHEIPQSLRESTDDLKQ